MKKIILGLLLIAGSVFLLKDEKAHVWIGPKIESPYAYEKLASKIYKHKGTVYIHLAGNGGNYEGVEYLMNLFNSVDKLYIVIEGNNYSGHAMLALHGKRIIFPEKGYLMLHLPSGLNMENEVCKDVIGKDRGLDAKQKCIKNTIKQVDIMSNEIIEEASPYLKAEEIKELKAGREVYVTYKELKRRINKRAATFGLNH